MLKENRRGWVVDQVLLIGHIEAGLTHFDELAISDTNAIQDAKKAYELRKQLMERLLEGKDAKYWCLIKHLSAAYVLAEEVCHANGYAQIDTINMTEIGNCLAGVLEEALGLERTACLRCLSEKVGVNYATKI